MTSVRLLARRVRRALPFVLQAPPFLVGDATQGLVMTFNGTKHRFAAHSEHLDKIDGIRLPVDRGDFTMWHVVSDYHAPDTRARWTHWHEIGHTVLLHDGPEYRTWPDWILDKEAHKFAREMLIDENHLRSYIAALLGTNPKITNEHIILIAQRYRVSPDAMLVALFEYGYPVAVNRRHPMPEACVFFHGILHHNDAERVLWFDDLHNATFLLRCRKVSP